MKTHTNPLRGALLVLLLPVLLMLGGCSLFGVATKGNLEELQVEQQAQNEQMATQLAGISNDLTAVENELKTNMAQLDTDVVQLQESMRTAHLALQSINVEMNDMAAQLDQVSHHGQLALDMHRDTMIEERKRLRLRMQELDDMIASWDHTTRPPATKQPASTTQLPPTVVPEQPANAEVSGNEPAKTKSGDETSVWDRKR